jgi:hypothetical protein
MCTSQREFALSPSQAVLPERFKLFSEPGEGACVKSYFGERPLQRSLTFGLDANYAQPRGGSSMLRAAAGAAAGLIALLSTTCVSDAQERKPGTWITESWRGSAAPKAMMEKAAEWVNTNCGTRDTSGIQGLVSENNQSNNWDVHIFCRVDQPGTTHWKGDSRGLKETRNIQDMASSMELGRLVCVGNVKGDANTTVLVLWKDE